MLAVARLRSRAPWRAIYSRSSMPPKIEMQFEWMPMFTAGEGQVHCCSASAQQRGRSVAMQLGRRRTESQMCSIREGEEWIATLPKVPAHAPMALATA